jgi:hypothetical protein
MALKREAGAVGAAGALPAADGALPAAGGCVLAVLAQPTAEAASAVIALSAIVSRRGPIMTIRRVPVGCGSDRTSADETRAPERYPAGAWC